MSTYSEINREAHKLLDRIPPSKQAFVYQMLNSINEIADDEFDEILLKRALYNKEHDEFSSLDDFARELGFDPDELRNNCK